jgi:RsiW-degrading membrane proteinase PrsW (M82 family)
MLLPLIGLLPVALFLLALVYLDTYKLVPFPRIVTLVAIGAAATGLSIVINDAMPVELRTLTRYAAPAVEETLKILPVIVLLRTRRLGFLVDSAIAGFAVGTGFALAENTYYMWALSGGSVTLWLARGFGTAVMHGGTTAIAAMLAKDSWKLAVPGLAAAFAIHSFFNHFFVSPIVSAVAMIILLPLLMVIVFEQSERRLRRWLGRGFDLSSDLLAAMSSGDFTRSHVGLYLQSLRSSFSAPVVADILCYLRLHMELSLRAKGILMLRESGLPVADDPDVADKLRELRYLKSSIGKTGELAVAPIVHGSPYDAWQLQLLR